MASIRKQSTSGDAQSKSPSGEEEGGHFERVSTDELLVQWDEVDAADIASIQMAMDFGLSLQHVLVPPSPATDGKSAGTGSDVPSPLIMEGEEGPLFDHKAFLAQLEEEDKLLMERMATVDSEEYPEEGEEQLCAGQDEGSDDDEEEGMMEAFANERTESREMMLLQDEEVEGEWTLLHVDGRRRIKGAAHGRVPLEDQDVCDEVEFKYEYRVCWRGPDGEESHTWDNLAWLLDAGYGKAIDAYNESKRDRQPTSTRRNRPKKPPTSRKHVAKMTQEQKAKYKAEQAKYKAFLAAQRHLVAGVADSAKKFDSDMKTVLNSDPFLAELLSVLFKCSMEQIPIRLHSLFSFKDSISPSYGTSYAYHFPALAIAPVPPTCGTRAAFQEMYRSFKPKVKLLFHGTRNDALAPIAEHGLRVPGEMGVSVRNGSACGVGIYSAEDYCTSLGYTNQRCMFICAGVDENWGNNKILRNSGVNVYFESHLIVPLLVVRVSGVSVARFLPPVPPPGGLPTGTPNPSQREALVSLIKHPVVVSDSSRPLSNSLCSAPELVPPQ